MGQSSPVTRPPQKKTAQWMAPAKSYRDRPLGPGGDPDPDPDFGKNTNAIFGISASRGPSKVIICHAFGGTKNFDHFPCAKIFRCLRPEFIIIDRWACRLSPFPDPPPKVLGGSVDPPPSCDIPSGCCFFTGPGQSPVLSFACCVESLLSVGRCGRCSCWCRFRIRRAQWLVCWGCAGCGMVCRLRVSAPTMGNRCVSTTLHQ